MRFREEDQRLVDRERKMVTSSEEVYATVTLTAIRINVRAEPDVQQNTSTEEEEEDLQLHKHQQKKQLRSVRQPSDLQQSLRTLKSGRQ